MVLVVGAGVIGLSAAVALARRGRDVCVIERRPRAGQESSTRNSGVIHAGLYHPPESLKTRLCHEGRERLYEYAAARGVPYVRCGKLVVSSAAEADALDRLRQSAERNGARVTAVDRAFVRAREPHVASDAALWSPDTGWIDADAYVRALVSEARDAGVPLLTQTDLAGVEPDRGGLVVATGRERIPVTHLVNAGGLLADEVSRMAGGEAFRVYPCRGEYAELSGPARALVRGLVYPVPHRSGHGLGVHLTRTLGGAVWIGPTIRYQNDKADYEGGRLDTEAFLAPTQALLPQVTLADLRPGPVGIRAKLHPPAEPFADFLIRRDTVNPCVVHAAGIDSPGLTASLAIAERLAALVEEG
jgi:L-2-hydroxyglutarate oxidase LhgO